MSEFKQLTSEEIAADQAVDEAIAEVEHATETIPEVENVESTSLAAAFEGLAVDGVEESKRLSLFISLSYYY